MIRTVKKYAIEYKALDVDISLRAKPLEFIAQKVTDFLVAKYGTRCDANWHLRNDPHTKHDYFTIYWDEYSTTPGKLEADYHYNYSFDVYPTDKLVAKTNEYENAWAKLTDAELKFFDGLDYKITPKSSSDTGQDITDWFGKAEDTVSDQVAIGKFLMSFCDSVSYNGGIDFDSLYTSPIEHHEIRPTSSGKYEFTIDGYEYSYEIRFDTKEMIKMDTHGFAALTNKELKFFDNLDYQIADWMSDNTGQHITDWFGKADDTEWEDVGIKKSEVTARMRQMGYVVEGDTGWNVLYASSQPKAGDQFIAIEVNFEEKTISCDILLKNEDMYETIRPSFFRLNELEFFDKAGFEFSDQFKQQTKQDISDWFGRV